MVKQMLEREPGAGQIEENLIRVRVAGSPGSPTCPAERRDLRRSARRAQRGSVCGARFPSLCAVFSIRSNSSGARRTVYGISGIGLLFISSRRTRRTLQ